MEETVDTTTQTLYLYLLRFEVRNEVGKFLYDNAFTVYVKDEAELQEKIEEIATTKAKGQPFVGADKRPHGLTMMRRHFPATINVPERGQWNTKVR